MVSKTRAHTLLMLHFILSLNAALVAPDVRFSLGIIRPNVKAEPENQIHSNTQTHYEVDSTGYKIQLWALT